jgi:hypothetical protein
MSRKCANIVIAALMVTSLASSLTIGLQINFDRNLGDTGGEQPNNTTAVFNTVYQTPEYPVGHEWDTGDGQQVYTPGWGGDIITVWADVILAPGTNLYVKYDYCNNEACYDGEPGGWDDMDFGNASYVLGWAMNHVSGTLYNYTLIGDWMKSYPTYPASTYAGIHVGYTVYAKNSTNSCVVVGEEYNDMFPYWPASSINVTANVSDTVVWAGNTMWVSGSAHYYHRLNWHDNPPVDEGNVTVSVNPVYQGKTNATGNFTLAFPVPMIPGIYTVNTTVWNDTKNWNGEQNRDATSVCANESITVHSIEDVTVGISAQAVYPTDAVWVNGTASYTDGNPMASKEINVTVEETAESWLTATNGAGTYSVQIAAPATPGAYTLNVTVNDPAHNLKRSNETSLQVTAPTLDVQLTVSSTTVLPDTQITVSGNATYGNGKPAALSGVNISFDGQPDFWTGTTDASGDFSLDIMSPSLTTTQTPPFTSQSFTLNVSVNGSAYAITAHNTTQILVTPVPMPDLSITQSEFVIDSADGLFLEGNEVDHIIYFNATVRNLGNADANNVAVNFTTNTTVFLGSTVVNVTAGGSALASVGWTAVEGVYAATVRIDPQNLIPESFENNNNATKNLAIDGDLDDDGIGDSVDPDIDGDGYNNTVDIFPEDPGEWNDTDGDGTGDNSDDDIDGDDVPNEDDAFPYDATEWGDIDGDGIGDNTDPDRDGDDVPNESDAFPENPDEWADYDGDGIGDNADTDDDNDGIPDAEDEYPHDTDNDGLDNTMDLDDDSDGIPDAEDVYPLDTDNDGLNNDIDTDDDGDGVDDVDDAFPLDPTKWSDTEVDGGGINIAYIILPIVVLGLLSVVLFMRFRSGAGGKTEEPAAEEDKPKPGLEDGSEPNTESAGQTGTPEPSPRPQLTNEEKRARIEQAYREGKMSEEQYLKNLERFN